MIPQSQPPNLKTGIQRVSFSACARQYMLAYEVMAAWEDNELPDELKDGHEMLPDTFQQLLDDTKDQRWLQKIVFCIGSFSLFFFFLT